jgi:type IV pilus assembly protein PilV
MKNQTGMMLIEALVSLVIAAIALLGTVTLMAKSTRSEMESYQRVQALTLVQDMVSRINANRQVAACYSVGTSKTNPTGPTGYSTTSAPTPCTSGSPIQNATVASDLAAWQNALLGSSETSGSNKVGAMIGAVGCITQIDPTNQIYQVSVAWQGLMPTATPKLLCGSGTLGNNNLQRVISVQIQIANLTTT